MTTGSADIDDLIHRIRPRLDAGEPGAEDLFDLARIVTAHAEQLSAPVGRHPVAPMEVAPAAVQVPEDPARPHIVGSEFQSDKYPTTPRGKVPLSVKDPTAQDLLWTYAQRRRAVDAQFADDLEFALWTCGYRPEPTTAPQRSAGTEAYTAPEQSVLVDAGRYRRLRVLGAAPSTSANLDAGTVLCFTNLDSFVDDDIAAHPSRGEAEGPPVLGSAPTDEITERDAMIARAVLVDYLRRRHEDNPDNPTFDECAPFPREMAVRDMARAIATHGAASRDPEVAELTARIREAERKASMVEQYIASEKRLSEVEERGKQAGIRIADAAWQSATLVDSPAKVRVLTIEHLSSARLLAANESIDGVPATEDIFAAIARTSPGPVLVPQATADAGKRDRDLVPSDEDEQTARSLYAWLVKHRSWSNSHHGEVSDLAHAFAHLVRPGLDALKAARDEARDTLGRVVEAAKDVECLKGERTRERDEALADLARLRAVAGEPVAWEPRWTAETRQRWTTRVGNLVLFAWSHSGEWQVCRGDDVLAGGDKIKRDLDAAQRIAVGVALALNGATRAPVEPTGKAAGFDYPAIEWPAPSAAARKRSVLRAWMDVSVEEEEEGESIWSVTFRGVSPSEPDARATVERLHSLVTGKAAQRANTLSIVDLGALRVLRRQLLHGGDPLDIDHTARAVFALDAILAGQSDEHPSPPPTPTRAPDAAKGARYHVVERKDIKGRPANLRSSQEDAEWYAGICNDGRHEFRVDLLPWMRPRNLDEYTHAVVDMGRPVDTAPAAATSKPPAIDAARLAEAFCNAAFERTTSFMAWPALSSMERRLATEAMVRALATVGVRPAVGVDPAVIEALAKKLDGTANNWNDGSPEERACADDLRRHIANLRALATLPAPVERVVTVADDLGITDDEIAAEWRKAVGIGPNSGHFGPQDCLAARNIARIAIGRAGMSARIIDGGTGGGK